MFENVPKPLTVFEDMPSTMVKTHAMYWNAMVACSQAGETRQLNIFLVKVFKFLAVEPSIEITLCYIDGLARNGQVKKDFTEVKCMINQEIVVSIFAVTECTQMHPTPVIFANEVLSYVESHGVVFYIDKSTYRQLAEDGATLNLNARLISEGVKDRQPQRVTCIEKKIVNKYCLFCFCEQNCLILLFPFDMIVMLKVGST